jgi:hypothetical protein
VSEVELANVAIAAMKTRNAMVPPAENANVARSTGRSDDVPLRIAPIPRRI